MYAMKDKWRFKMRVCHLLRTYFAGGDKNISLNVALRANRPRREEFNRVARALRGLKRRTSTALLIIAYRFLILSRHAARIWAIYYTGNPVISEPAGSRRKYQSAQSVRGRGLVHKGPRIYSGSGSLKLG